MSNIFCPVIGFITYDSNVSEPSFPPSSHTFSKADLGKLAVVPSRYVNVTVGITLFGPSFPDDKGYTLSTFIGSISL